MTTALLQKLVALDATSLKTWMLLAAAQRQSDKVRVYRKDLGAVLGRSERTVTRAIRTLRTAGLLARTGKARYAVTTGMKAQ